MANDIGAKIKFLRKFHGLIQEDFGAIFHYSRCAITNFEANNRTPPIECLQKIADYFNINIVYFFEDNSSNLDTELLPYIEGNKPFNIENLSPEKKTKILQLLYNFKKQSDESSKCP